MSRELLTINQTAEYLGVTRRTIERWIAAGRIPAFRVAGTRTWRIDRADLENTLKPDQPQQDS